jgi:hypothetical protein
MRRLSVLLGLGLLFAGANLVTAADPATGNWKVVVVNNYQIDLVESIIKLDQAEGKWTGELVVAGPFVRNVKVKSVSIDKDRVRVVILKGAVESVFDGTLDGDKTVIGSYGDDRRTNAAKLIWTEDEKLDQASAIVRKKLPAPLQEMDKMQMALNVLRNKLRQAKDDDEKKTLRTEIADKQKEVDSATPSLLKKTIAEHADDPAAFDAAVMLIRGAAKYRATADELRQWADLAMNSSSKYGPRFRQDTQIMLAEAMVTNPALRSVAAEFAKKAEADLGAEAPTAKQVRVLTTLVAALGALPEGKPFAERLEKLETMLDTEYLAKHAKLKVEPYAGRKEGGNKAVMMELFTGAQCPPCVAADIAFDKLCDNYKAKDIVLLQYHMHIPGPDPMTNADTEARWKYYTDAYPKDVGGVPTSIFNGKPESGGGGGEDRALPKLAEFRKLIDPILDEETKTKLTVKATRSGELVTINASVADLAEHGDSVKLRFALVEETIRYAGGNGIRFHHHVVRSMPGGPDGMAMAGPNETKQVTVNLTELRGNLTKYLDDFVEKRGPFPKPNRPLDLKHLKAVAWVQDDKDENRAILIAAIVDVVGASGAE